MAQFLATLYSPSRNCPGLAIIDSDHGLIYMQSIDLPSQIVKHQLRGMAHYKNNLYVTTPASVLIFSIEKKPKPSFFCLKKEILLPEWLLGSESQADIFGVLVSAKRKQFFVTNNYFNAIDIFTLDGVFIKRRFLHEISPQLFSPSKGIHNPFRYGHIRSICEAPDDSILLSVGSINGSYEGCVINFDNGEIVLDGLRAPHGLVVTKDCVIVQETGLARVSAYSYPADESKRVAKHWATNIAPIGIAGDEKDQISRGLVYADNSIYCGVVCSTNAADDKNSTYIISFDAITGIQNKSEICLPHIEGLEQLQVYFMVPLPIEIGTVETSNPVFLQNGKQTKRIPASRAKMVTRADYQSHLKLAKEKRPAVVLDKVSLAYRRTAISHFSFKKHLRKSKKFQALKCISFTIYEGETVGIIGRNGSGKSTISMLISGALPVDAGILTTCGHVQLLSIGLGFQPKLTGRENVYINGALLGLSQKNIFRKMYEIEEFAEIGDFIDEPVRTYSAGMRSRLGFAIATAVRPDILILDEVMSTGDAAFRKKADKRMLAMREQTKTIIMISHNSQQIRRMCSRVIWLNKGELMMDGTPEVVLSKYDDFCNDSA